MKTVNVKKFLTIHSKLLIVLLLYTVVTAHTQSSPEAIIGQTPDLPSAKTLAAYAGSDNEAAQQQVRAFLKKIREIDSVYTRSVTPEITDADIADVKAQADRQAKQLTGYSAEQLQNMSEEQQAEVGKKAAQKKMNEVNEQLSAFGLGNIDRMANMSEDQMMAAMGANMGLTPDEMNAMSKMSDKEIEAYMKQGDRAQRMQNSQMAKAAEKNAAKQPKVNPDDVLVMQKAAEDQQAYMQRINDLQKLIESERTELARQFADKEERTQRSIAASEAGKIAADCDGKTIYTDAQCKAAWATVSAKWQACREECFSLWINQIVKEQGRIKALLPEARRVDDLNAKSSAAQARLQPNLTGSLTQKTQAMPIHSASLVSLYLNATADVVTYPIDK